MRAGFALDYEPNLSSLELDRLLEQLVATGRRCEWLLCRYLADIADERRFRDVGWYADVLHYAKHRFGMGVKLTRERVRIGRALRSLPRIEQAFVEGTLCYSRVREVTRVATAEDEVVWLELGGRLEMRELERRVAGQLGAKEVCDRPGDVVWRTPETVELRMKLPAEVWALVSRAMQGARQAAERPLSDTEALEAVAREALASLCQPDSTTIADPRKALVLYQCRDCGQSELETTAGAVALPPAAAARLSCGARVVDLATEGTTEACVGGCIPAAIRRAVLARDRGRCRVCGRRRYVDVHHLEPQAEGGAHSRENCCCLCTTCHAALHEGKLHIEGSAESGLRWFDADGQLLGADDDQAAATPRARAPASDATKVLKAMGGRGGWTTDALVEATGLPVQTVMVALAELELAAQVRQQMFGVFAPAGAGLAPEREAPGTVDAPIGASGVQKANVHAPSGASHIQSSAAEEDRAAVAPPARAPSSDADAVLEAMGGCGGWTSDALVEVTGLQPGAVMVALTQLELAAQIRLEAFGVFAPVGAGVTRRRGSSGGDVETPSRSSSSWPHTRPAAPSPSRPISTSRSLIRTALRSISTAT